MDIKEIIPVIHDAMGIIFKKQFQVEVKLKSLKECVSDDELKKVNKYQAASVALLNSKKMDFCIGLGFTKNSFLKYVSEIFGEEYTDLNDEIRDLIGEWLNLILGRAKGKLNDTLGYSFTNTIPLVIVGENLSIKNFEKDSILVYEFESKLGSFFVFYMVGKEGVVPWDEPEDS